MDIIYRIGYIAKYWKSTWIMSRTKGSQSTVEHSCFASRGTISVGAVPA